MPDWSAGGVLEAGVAPPGELPVAGGGVVAWVGAFAGAPVPACPDAVGAGSAGTVCCPGSVRRFMVGRLASVVGSTLPTPEPACFGASGEAASPDRDANFGLAPFVSATSMVPLTRAGRPLPGVPALATTSAGAR